MSILEQAQSLGPDNGICPVLSMESGSGDSPEGVQRSTSFKRSPRVRKTLSKAFSRELKTEDDETESRNKDLKGILTAKLVTSGRRAGRSNSSLLRLGSASLDDETPTGQDAPAGLRKISTSGTGQPATSGSFRRKARRSLTMAVAGIPDEEEAAQSPNGANRLMILTSAVTTLQSAVKEKAQDVVVGDPNEVILDSDDDSDDDENEEIERDFVSALQRVQDSGRLSLQELRVFEKELKESAPKLFENESDMVILAGLHNARYIEVKSDEVLWSRYSELYSGVLSLESPICILVKGRVSVAKPGIPEGVKVLKGSVINSADPDVLGIVAVEPCKLLYIDSSQVEEDMERAKKAWRKVDYNLRKKRPTSTWPEDGLDDLVFCVHHMPFFENFDLRTLRSVLRNLRFQCMPTGESLPPRQEAPGASPSGINRPDLVLLWEGKAGKYKRVQSADEQMMCTQMEMMALEGLGRKMNRAGPPGAPSSKEDLPELDDETVDKKDGKVYLKRYGNLRQGAVLGERDLIDPGGPETGQPIVRCEGPCYVLTLARADYLHCLKERVVTKAVLFKRLSFNSFMLLLSVGISSLFPATTQISDLFTCQKVVPSMQ